MVDQSSEAPHQNSSKFSSTVQSLTSYLSNQYVTMKRVAGHSCPEGKDDTNQVMHEESELKSDSQKLDRIVQALTLFLL